MSDSQNQLTLLEKIEKTNKYLSRNWSLEESFRYVVKLNNKILEASVFVHSDNDGKFVKLVIELPTSYGCSVGCKHCASGLITNSKLLSQSEIISLYDYVHNLKHITHEKLLITFSGIGEGAFIRETIFEASREIFKRNRNCYFTFTSVGFDPTFVKYINNISLEIPIHYFQISYLHYDVDFLNKIIPTAIKLRFNFIKLINAIQDVTNVRIRLNFVVIKDFNDSDDHLLKLILLLEGIKNKITIRVSKLNETEAGIKNNLKPASVKTLHNIVKRFSENGYKSYVFASLKNDNLNCGQLVWRYNDL